MITGRPAVIDQRALPSGRTLLVLRARDGMGEELEVRSSDGRPEVRIVLGPHGPEVTLAAARLELEAPTLAVRCRDLEVRAEAGIALDAGKSVAVTSQGEIRLKSAEDLHANGAIIRLNCDEPSAPASGGR